MSEAATQATPDTSTTPAPAQGLATESTSTPAAATSTPAPAATGTPAQGLSTPALEFIPESFRESAWAKKYSTPEEFFKGVDNMAKLIGQKEIINVQGIQKPGENATPEELNAFYSSLGRPESAEKYEFSPDIQVHEGLDLATAQKGISDVAFELGLNNQQTNGLMKAYAALRNQEFQATEAKVKETFDKAVVTAFGADFQGSLALAKKGAKALGIATTLDNEGLSANPTVLKLCAELGKFTGEDSFEKGDGAESHETLLAEAKRLIASPEYKTDPKVQARTVEIYKKVYG